MGDTHTTTNSDVVADDLVALKNGDETKIVGEHIGSVVGGHGDGHLELSRKVGWAVNWLEVGNLSTTDLLLVKPDLVVRRGFGQQRVGERL